MVHLISDKLVELVEKHSDIIIKRWTARLLSDPTTSSFSEKNLKAIKEKAHSVIKHLGKWVNYDTGKDEIGRRYAEEGINLFAMKIPLCEAVRALVVLRRTLWLFVINESRFDSPLEMHQMSELNDRVIVFFDRALYYMIRGYTEAMNKRMKETASMSKDDLEEIFFEHSFYNK